MLRTLRITSVIVALAAVVLLILPVFFGVRRDPAVEALLNKPSAIEQFLSSYGRQSPKDEVVSPLVKQAMAFALILNPPPPPVIEKPPEITLQPEEPQPISPVTAKFDLIGTSFYPKRPQSSFCLIDEPGKGLSWVKQGSSVGHLTIEEVKDGKIILSDGKKKSEMTVPVKELWKTLLKDPLGEKGDVPPMPSVEQPFSSVKTSSSSRPSQDTRAGRSPANPTGEDPRSRIRSATAARRTRTSPALPQSVRSATPVTDPANPADRVVPAVSDDDAAQKESEETEPSHIPPPPIPTEKDIIHARLMEEVRANRLTPEEAKQIEETAQTIAQAEEIQAKVQEARENKPASRPAARPNTKKPK